MFNPNMVVKMTKRNLACVPHPNAKEGFPQYHGKVRISCVDWRSLERNKYAPWGRGSNYAGVSMSLGDFMQRD
jgi:hypothetical protein